MYSTQLYISPNTLTNLTVFVNQDDIDYDVLDITAFTDDGERLKTNIRFNNYSIVTIYSPGYKPKTVTIDDYTATYDIYLDAISEYSNINNSYYCKDDYNRNYVQSAFKYLEEVKANSASTADKTLSNVTYIDSNSAVKTALNGKANTSLSNLNSTGQAVIDGKVSKTGDTMTGVLTIHTDVNDKFIVKDNRIARGTIPSSAQYSQIRYVDKDENPLANIYYRYNTNGDVSLRLNCTSSDGGSTAGLYIGFNSSGAKYCTFPNSVCVDGQWVYSAYTICSSRNAETSDKDWDLSAYLPNDNYNYEVLIVGISVTGAASGNINRIYLKSSFITSNCTLVACLTRTSASNSVYGMSPFPIGADKILTVGGYSNNTGTYSLYLRGYRRIGTNS